MPIRQLSSTVQAWMIAPCPTVTFRPSTVFLLRSTWITVLSWMFVFSPMTIFARSARRTQLYQTLAPSFRMTAPMRCAPGATKLAG